MSTDTNIPYDLQLPLDAFVRAIGANKQRAHSLFLGAGASISSSVPSAEQCVWLWKRDIFLTNNPGLESQFGELSLPSTRERIQTWLNAQGRYPRPNDTAEYSFYAEASLPLAEDRRAFFEECVRAAHPHYGYQVLPALAQGGVIDAVWSTNFDGLSARVCQSAGVTPFEVASDSAHRLESRRQPGSVLCVALHGDYRYDAIKNTDAELQRQDESLRAALIQHARSNDLIVVGYSGRDASVIDALREAYSVRSSSRLYWCLYGSEMPLPRVLELVRIARANGHQAVFVPTEGFDDLMVRISLHCLDGEAKERARATWIQSARGRQRSSPPFGVPGKELVGFVKSNAFKLECPAECFDFQAKGLPAQGVWRYIRERTNETDVVAVPCRGRILSFGALDDINEIFKTHIDGDIQRVPIGLGEMADLDGPIHHLLETAFVYAAARDLGLGRRRGVLWTLDPLRRELLDGQSYFVHDAAVVSLRVYGGSAFVVLKPTLHAIATDGEPAPTDVIQEVKRRGLTRQYNRHFNDAFNRWRQILLAHDGRFEWPVNVASPFRFGLKPAPLYVGLKAIKPAPRSQVAATVLPYLGLEGAVFEEPKLRFATATQRSSYDEHPIRGLRTNRPYDFPLTASGIASTTRVGIVGAKVDLPRFVQFLATLRHPAQPDTKKEYLLEYPGYEQAFRLPLDLPSQTSSLCAVCPEPDPTHTVEQGAAALFGHLARAIDGLVATERPHVLVICIPERWRRFERYENATTSFDLHDSVKAYCAQRGLASQLIREATLNKSYKCEVRWWLSLSLYTKSMRTPWVLDNADRDTAFVGLGFSIDPVAERGRHVLVGCSHLYSSQGYGLKYQLNKIDDFVIRRGNPFLGESEARRTGERIRELFFEAMQNTPRRVVIHKRTPFDSREVNGLLDGLSGVSDVDLIEVAEEPVLRFLAARSTATGQAEADPFPIKRGTAVVLDGRTALCWVHGTTAGVAGRQYYLGASRIPGPLRLVRHHGAAPLGQLASELLGLSKMNWNTFDMYSKMPATVQSSNAIARIGRLLERFDGRSYDYRLLI